MTEISCILWQMSTPDDMKTRSIQNIRHLMTAHRLTAVDVSRAMSRGDDGQWVRAVLAGRNQTGLREMGDYLRKTYGMPATWPEMAQAVGMKLAEVRHAGSVGAGPGQYTESDFDAVLLPSSWLSPKSCGMTVVGESGYPVLFDGDRLLGEECHEVIEGYIMVFRTSDGLTVKVPAMTARGWTLESFNPDFPPMLARDVNAHPVCLVEGIYRTRRGADEEMAIRRKGGFPAEVLKRKIQEANFFA